MDECHQECHRRSPLRTEARRLRAGTVEPRYISFPVIRIMPAFTCELASEREPGRQVKCAVRR
jgi:hypothetical protein